MSDPGPDIVDRQADEIRDLRLKIKCYEAFMRRLKTNLACTGTNMGKREYDSMFGELDRELAEFTDE